MADFAVHLNQATKSYGRPSVFDLIAQDSLMATLRPAFEFSVRTLADRFPEKLSGILAYVDEIFYGFITLTERHFIWTKNASFAEFFYGLSRIDMSSLIGLNSSREVGWKKKILSLLSLTLLPYILTKLEKKYAEIKEELIVNEAQPIKRWKYLICKLYPYMHCIMEGGKLVTLVCYVLKLIDVNSIPNALIGVTLAYSNANSIEKPTKVAETQSHGTLLLLLSKCIGICTTLFSMSIEYALPAVMFLLRFLEWWYSSDNNLQQHIDSLPIPQPPTETKV
eukprot:gene17470-19217_t